MPCQSLWHIHKVKRRVDTVSSATTEDDLLWVMSDKETF